LFSTSDPRSEPEGLRDQLQRHHQDGIIISSGRLECLPSLKTEMAAGTRDIIGPVGVKAQLQEPFSI
jgi:hypothetical protein